MTRITMNSLDWLWNTGFFATVAHTSVKALRNYIRLRQTRRTIIAELEQFSPHEIGELGITRADIAHVADDWVHR